MLAHEPFREPRHGATAAHRSRVRTSELTMEQVLYRILEVVLGVGLGAALLGAIGPRSLDGDDVQPTPACATTRDRLL